ncbi:MAG: hypothetical protein HUU32_21345 [Calditrichaceae bacterium]|nr:hypothetical protein [Calditrichia bacterium]NUQ43942.1 hypothetical protein [Calditrichaceae bacterium]
MAAPHPGKWETVVRDFQCLNPEFTGTKVLNTEQTAIHACIIYNPAPVRKWKVLYFYAGEEEGDDIIKSRIWDPNPPQGVSSISSQIIPNWNGPETDLPRMICSGHCHLPDGRILFAGGTRPQENSKNRGLPYTYIFNPVNESWNIAGLPGPKHAMADGR